jgi:hypothetical protein
METKALVWLILLSLLFGDLSGKSPTILRTGSASEGLAEIKNLLKRERPDLLDRRGLIVKEIVGISRSRNPNAVAALMDLVLYEPLSDFDKGVSHQAVWALLQYALTELPVIPDSNLPDFPGRDDPDPEKRRLNLANYYYHNYEAAFIACRAWCQEVREGKRTFQLTGSKIRYNHLGQPANAPPPRIHSQNPPRTETKAPQATPPKKHPATNWLIGLCALAILFGVIKLVKSH